MYLCFVQFNKISFFTIFYTREFCTAVKNETVDNIPPTYYSYILLYAETLEKKRFCFERGSKLFWIEKRPFSRKVITSFFILLSRQQSQDREKKRYIENKTVNCVSTRRYHQLDSRSCRHESTKATRHINATFSIPSHTAFVTPLKSKTKGVCVLPETTQYH